MYEKFLDSFVLLRSHHVPNELQVKIRREEIRILPIHITEMFFWPCVLMNGFEIEVYSYGNRTTIMPMTED